MLGKVLIFVALAAIFENCTSPKQAASTATTPTTSITLGGKMAESQTKTVTEKKTEYERWQQRAEYTMNVDFDHKKSPRSRAFLLGDSNLCVTA